MKFLSRTVIFLIQTVAIFFRALGWRACRFYPTCSCYATQAAAELPFFKACRAILNRILRCHPFCEGGFDPLWKNEHL